MKAEYNIAHTSYNRLLVNNGGKNPQTFRQMILFLLNTISTEERLIKYQDSYALIVGHILYWTYPGQGR